MALKCAAARKWISDYVDAGCDARQASALERHLRACPECRALLADFQSLKESAGELSSLEPPDEIWPKIRSRLSAEMDTAPKPATLRPARATAAGFRWALGTALAVVLIVGGMYIGSMISKGPSFLGRPSGEAYTLAKLREAEQHYQKAIVALTEAFASREGTTDPMILAEFRRNIAIIDRSLEACRRAVSNDPENIEPRSYLLAVYREKLDLLADMINIQDRTSQTPGAKTTL